MPTFTAREVDTIVSWLEWSEGITVPQRDKLEAQLRIEEGDPSEIFKKLAISDMIAKNILTDMDVEFSKTRNITQFLTNIEAVLRGKYS